MGSTSGKGPTWKDPLPSETTQAQQPADSQLDYSDAKRGLEPPAERRAREQPDNPARQTHSHQHVVFPPKRDTPSLLCGDLIVDEAERVFCVFERAD
jgi:hypothetical protein